MRHQHVPTRRTERTRGQLPGRAFSARRLRLRQRLSRCISRTTRCSRSSRGGSSRRWSCWIGVRDNAR